MAPDASNEPDSAFLQFSVTNDDFSANTHCCIGKEEPAHDAATHVVCHAYDAYDTNLSLGEALKDDVLLGHRAEGQPLAAEHGGPVRMITPQLYAWKGAKWIQRLEFLAADRKGFWELRGYSNTAHPWRNDRYS